ncbi:MAG TPA: MBL fold metallo-hydrolase [Candidatus Pacearchaeota archaeon]|nr:MBL fold metallo-hydrolase [Candidatus Pacearchaeota archaeon]
MEVCTVGGFEEVGKNMTAIKTGDDVFIFDAGLFIPGIVELQEEHVTEYTHRFKKRGRRIQQYPEKKLRSYGAIPDDTILDKLGWREKVRAIFLSHAHLDHVGGIPYLLNRYQGVPIYGTPFTIKFLEAMLEDEKVAFNNPLRIVQSDSTHTIKGKSGSYNVDFIHTTHSTIHCVFIALHTKEGIFFYGMDLKFDNYPTMGKPPNYEKIKEIGKKGVKLLIIDALYSRTEEKPGGEKIAQHMLEDAISKLRGRNSAFFLTTFSSHIERLTNAVKFAETTKREIVFLGRSLSKYVETATKVNSCPFRNKVRLIKYAKQRESFLRKLEHNREKYFVFCTGHQAEENSVLDRIVKGTTPFSFKEGDHLIFSSSIIPVPENILARKKLDGRLRKAGVNLQTNVHVHGHGSREDMRELIRMLKPKHIIPAHGSLQQETPMIELANEMGYKFGETSHLASNGKVLKF